MSRRDHLPDDQWLEDALRRALDEEAASVEVGEDGLDRILERTGTHEWRWGRIALAAAAVTVASGLGVAALVGGDEPVVVSPGPAVPTEAVPTPTPTPTEPAPTTTPDATPSPDDGATATPAPAPPPLGDPITVPAYYATDTDAGLRLAREFRTAPEQGDPVRTAVQVMIAGPADPDYTGLWNPATRVLGVDVGAEVVEVDLSAEARQASLGSAAAEMAVQQLVYTATAAAQSGAPVRILVEGAPVDELFGHVDVSEPVRRADPLSVRLLAQVNDPGEGAVVGSPVRVTGEAAAFEATVRWQVLRDGVVVEEGFTMAEEALRLAPFSFVVELDPGTYLLVVTDDDASGGTEGFAPMRDTKTFTVSPD